ncbi:CARDB domain-containing protein, partial [Limnospira sp. PMC 1223.20]
RTNASGTQGETDATNNLQAVAMSLSAPDLTVVTVTAPSSAAVNGLIAVSWTVENIGSGSAPANWQDRIYVSTQPTRDGSEVYVAAFEVGAH